MNTDGTLTMKEFEQSIQINKQSAELTKLKADVVKLRTALEGLVDASLNGASLERHHDNEIDQLWFNAYRALEETKP